MIKQKKLWDNILTVIMALLCLLWIYPIVLILRVNAFPVDTGQPLQGLHP